MNLKLQDDDTNLSSDPELYRSLVGKLSFLTNTRLDLAYSVQTISQFMQHPSCTHFSARKHLLRYVHFAARQGILLKAGDRLILQEYSENIIKGWG